MRSNIACSVLLLTHWGRATHICVGKLTIIGSDNGLSTGRRQAIIGTNAGILLIGSVGINFSEILIEIHTFSFRKMHLKMSSAKWRPFCLGLNVLTWRRHGMDTLHALLALCEIRFYLLLVKQKLFNKQLGRITSDIRRHDTFLAAYCRDKWIENFLIWVMHDILWSGILSLRINSHVIRVLKIIYSVSGLHCYLWGAPFPLQM